ncbi:hypothetical protein Tco_0033969 [Tanacetum coccineum]
MAKQMFCERALAAAMLCLSRDATDVVVMLSIHVAVAQLFFDATRLTRQKLPALRILLNFKLVTFFQSFISSACKRTHCKHTAEDDLEVFSTDDLGLDWISAHNFLTCLQKLSSYTSGHFEVSELHACLEKLHFPALLVMSKFSRICFSLVILEVPLSEYFGFDMNSALNFLCSI